MIDRMTIGEHSIPTYGTEVLWDDDNSVKGRYDPLIYARLMCNREQFRVLKHAKKKGKRVGLASLAISVSLHSDMLMMTQPASVQGRDKTMVTLYRPQAEGIGTDLYYFVAGVDAPLTQAFVDFIETATQYPAPPLCTAPRQAASNTAPGASEAAVETLTEAMIEDVIAEYSCGIRQVIPDDGHYKGYRTTWSNRVWKTEDDRKQSRLLTARLSDKEVRAALEELKQTTTTGLPATTLMTPEIRETLPPIKGTERDDDPMVRFKFFTPDSSFTWWPLEFDGDDTFFGLVDSGTGQGKELGYFSLSELEDTQAGSLGLPIERDLHFTPRPLSDLYPELFR